MPTDDERLDNLPTDIADRARDLRAYGLPLTLAVGRAATTLDSPDREWDLDDVAADFGITEDTLQSYASKARDRIKAAQRLLVAEHGGPTYILAEKDKPARNGTVFIASEFGYHQGTEYEAATEGEGKVAVITVNVGGPSGEPSHNRTIKTNSFSSLDALADAKYRDCDHSSSEHYSFWYNLLVDAGVDAETLDKPREKLPASHPDSADHVQYQMQSLEPPEDRRPPRR